MDQDWGRRRVVPLSTRGLSAEVDVGAVGPARVEPAFESRVDDQPNQRLAHLRHPLGPPLPPRRPPALPPRADLPPRHGHPSSPHPIPATRAPPPPPAS